MPVKKLLFLVVAILFAAAVAWLGCGRQARLTRWTMINVTPGQIQADCHLIEFPDGRKVLIDAGEASDAPGVLFSYLTKHRIKRLDLVVLSHFHRDHYGRLLDIVNAGIAVDRVAVNLPASREIADAERPWGCDWEEVQSVLRFLADKKIPYFTPRNGEGLIELQSDSGRTALEVVCLYDGLVTPVGRTDINDTSMIIRLTHGPTRVLFTGDLNQRLGTWLATSDFDLKADILKVPHHGTEGAAPNEFFSRVAPKAALVPSPSALWFSQRSKRIREYFSEHQIPVYVTGIHGTVTVEIKSGGYVITSERPDAKP